MKPSWSSAAWAAVLQVQGQAGAGPPGPDDRAVRARAHRRQRAHPQQHREVVQPTDRRCPGGATRVAQDYYRERELSATAHAARTPELRSRRSNRGPCRRPPRHRGRGRAGRVGLVEVYRSRSKAGSGLTSCRWSRSNRRVAARRRSRVGRPPRVARRHGGAESHTRAARGRWRAVRGGAAVRDAPGRVGRRGARERPARGSGHARQADHRGLQNRSQLHALRRPILGVYLTLFIMMTPRSRSATWTGWHLAKRITRPVQRAAAGARERAGHLDHRIEPETRDEFGSLVEAFNTMAGELAASQRARAPRASISNARTSNSTSVVDIEGHFERIATGVVSLGAAGQIETINGAALRLLEVDRPSLASGPRRHRARGSQAARDPAEADAGRRRSGAGGTGNRVAARRPRVASCCGRDAAPARRRQRWRCGSGVRRRGPRSSGRRGLPRGATWRAAWRTKSRIR